MKSVICVLLFCCVGVVISTSLSDIQKSTFQGQINQVATDEDTKIKSLKVSIALQENTQYTANNDLLKTYDTALQNIIDSNYTTLTTTVVTAYETVCQKCFDNFDKLSTAIANNTVLVDPPPSGCNVTKLTASLNKIVSDGISACTSCYVNEPPKIKKVINDCVSSGNTALGQYRIRSDLCLLPFGDDPKCYSSGILNVLLNILPPETSFNEATNEINICINELNNGNTITDFNDITNTPCSRTAIDNGNISYANLKAPNRSCFK